MEKEVESVLKLISDAQKSSYEEIEKLKYLFEQLKGDKQDLNNEYESNNDENEEEEEDDDADPDETKNCQYDLNFFYVKSPSKSRKYYSCSDKSRVIYKGSDEYVESEYIKYVQKKKKTKPKECNSYKNITVREITSKNSKIRNIEITHHITNAFSDEDNEEEEKICLAKVKNMTIMSDSKKNVNNKMREVYKQKYVIKKENQKDIKIDCNEKSKKKIEEVEPKIDKSVGIDELLKIIEESDTKKGKKKNKNKKNDKNEKESEKLDKQNNENRLKIDSKIQQINNNINKNITDDFSNGKSKNSKSNVNDHSLDKLSTDDLSFIENFRKNISIQSIHKCLVYKQDPIDNEDWIKTINSLN